MHVVAVVPAGLEAGDRFLVETEHGLVSVVVPPGLDAGDKLGRRNPAHGKAACSCGRHVFRPACGWRQPHLHQCNLAQHPDCASTGFGLRLATAM